MRYLLVCFLLHILPIMNTFLNSKHLLYHLLLLCLANNILVMQLQNIALHGNLGYHGQWWISLFRFFHKSWYGHPKNNKLEDCALSRKLSWQFACFQNWSHHLDLYLGGNPQFNYNIPSRNLQHHQWKISELCSQTTQLLYWFQNCFREVLQKLSSKFRCSNCKFSHHLTWRWRWSWLGYKTWNQRCYEIH